MVVDGPGEDPSATERAAWLRELHPDATVMVVPDPGADEDSVGWARRAPGHGRSHDRRGVHLRGLR